MAVQFSPWLWWLPVTELPMCVAPEVSGELLRGWHVRHRTYVVFWSWFVSTCCDILWMAVSHAFRFPWAKGMIAPVIAPVTSEAPSMAPGTSSMDECEKACNDKDSAAPTHPTSSTGPCTVTIVTIDRLCNSSLKTPLSSKVPGQRENPLEIEVLIGKYGNIIHQWGVFHCHASGFQSIDFGPSPAIPRGEAVGADHRRAVRVLPCVAWCALVIAGW